MNAEATELPIVAATKAFQCLVNTPNKAGSVIPNKPATTDDIAILFSSFLLTLK